VDQGGEKDVEQIRRARRIREIHSLETPRVKAKLQGVKVKLSTRAGDTGRLFGSITRPTSLGDQGRGAVGRRQAPAHGVHADQDARRAQGHGSLHADSRPSSTGGVARVTR